MTGPDRRRLELDFKHQQERNALEQAIYEERLTEYARWCNRPETDYILVAIPRLTERQIQLLRFLSVGRTVDERKFMVRYLFGTKDVGPGEMWVLPPEVYALREFIHDDWVTGDAERYGLTLLGKAALKHYTE